MTSTACRALAAVPICLLGVSAAAEDYVLALEDTGLREYYCQITVRLENRSDAPLMEISGHFFSFVKDAQVGSSPS